MTDGRPMATLRELVGFLGGLVEDGKTGTLFLATQDNHSATFSMEAGRIVAVTYQRKKGREALQDITAITGTRYRFTPYNSAVADPAGGDLPPTDEILRYLASGATSAQAPHAAPAAGGNGGQVPHIALPKKEVGEIVIEEATEYLGPMAMHVCGEYFAEIPPESTAALVRVLDRIGAEIEGAGRDSFKMRVLDRVSRLLG